MKFERKSVSEILLVVLIFACLTLGLTFPVITKITTEIAGGGSDLYQTAADVITAKTRFEQLGFFGSVRDTIIHQKFDSISLYGHYSVLFGFPLGYNIYWLLSFLLSALGMYFLTRTLLKEHAPSFPAIPYISFFAGLVYAFTPAHYHWSIGFRGATHIEWIPWTILLLHLLLKRPTVTRFIGLLVFCVLLFKGESHFAAFFILFLVPYVLFFRKKVKALIMHRRFKWFALIFIIICAAVLVFSYSRYFNISLSGNNYLDPGIDQAINYSNDLLGILTPTYNQAIWGDIFDRLRNMFTGNEFSSPSYIGVVVLILSAFALWRRRTNTGRFWLFIGIGFFILSLGPVLHIAGIIEPRIPLPYILIYKFIPFFENIRTVNRLIIFAVLGFSLASSFGLLRIIEHKIKSVHWQRLIPIIFAGLVIIEYLSIPVTTTKLHHSPFYDKIRYEPGDYQILEIPSATSYDASSLSSYYLRIHKKKLVNDYQFGRQDSQNAGYIRNTKVPILNELIYRLPRNTDLVSHTAIDTSDPDVNTAILNKYNARYITLSKEFIGDTTDKISLRNFIGIKSFIRNNLKTRKVYEDNDLIAYQLLPENSDSPVLTLGSGWSHPMILENVAYQWVSGLAKLNIDSPSGNDSLTIAFNARTNKKSLMTLKIERNNSVIGQYVVTPEPQPIMITLPAINPGNNEIVFTALYPSGGAISKNIEKSIGISNIKISNTQAQDMTSDAFFGARLSGNVLEIPYQNSTDSLIQNGVHVIAPQEILESYRDKIGGAASAKLPILSDLMLTNYYTDKSLSKLNDILSPDHYRAEIASILHELDIRHVAIRTDLLPTDQANALQKFINDMFPVKERPKTSNHVLYDVRPSSDRFIAFIQPYGLSSRKLRVEPPLLIRKLKVDSSIILTNPTTQIQTGQLSISLNACRNQARIVNIQKDANNVASLVIDSKQYTPRTIPVELQPGENELLLEVVGSDSKILTNADLQQCPIGVAGLSFQSS